MKFSVALLRIAAIGNDQDKNLARGVEACIKAKKLGADLAVFPELWNIGASPAPLDPEGRRAWMSTAIDRERYYSPHLTCMRFGNSEKRNSGEWITGGHGIKTAAPEAQFPLYNHTKGGNEP